MNPVSSQPTIIYIAIAILCIVTNVVAFIFQFFYYEPPCPLCLLQRFGFIAIGLGALLSIIYNPSWKYDMIIFTSSIYTLMVGLRQVLLHILPHDLGYGNTFLGLHFYTWSAIISFSLILLMSIIPIISLILSKFSILQFYPSFVPTLIEISLIIITLVNVFATYFECGFGMCPSDPTTYLEWKNLQQLFSIS
ncbi:disulfide bond formation protein B [Candidatus Tisiphia endosymbiont of Metellina segmentata]|uniref:disulfide bond formation protein B n=1 Tax=Candidatus Tisiphia endosymbiont of Metellina segmentata TaxID=3066274 RepID=UPI00313DD9AB